MRAENRAFPLPKALILAGLLVLAGCGRGQDAYDKAFYGDAIELPDDSLMIHQERTYASPIWYTP